MTNLFSYFYFKKLIILNKSYNILLVFIYLIKLFFLNIFLILKIIIADL